MAVVTTRKTDANGFSPTTMIALVLVGIVCLTGITLLSAFEPELTSGNDGASHALSKSSVGYSGFVSLLSGSGQEAAYNRRELNDEQERSTLVLAPNSATQPEQIEDFRHFGPIVILMPKWLVSPDQKRRGWSQLAGRVPASSALNILPEDWLEGGSSDLNEAGSPQRVQLQYRSFVKNSAKDFGVTNAIEGLRTVSGSVWIPVVAGPSGGAVIAKHKKENVYLIADSDLFNNAGLANIANARLMAHFMADIKEDDNPVVFDLTLNGFQRQPNLGRVALEPPVLGATLCLLLTAILIGLQAAVRFLPPAPVRRAVALGKRALADTTAGLVRMGKCEHRMALPYANLLKRQVAKAISAPTTLDPVALTETLDKVSALSKSQLRFSVLAGEAAAVSSEEDLIRVGKDLHRWKQETTRERQ